MKTGYYGEKITRDDSWMLEIAKIPEELRLEEPELTHERWFDYRHLLPAQATYLFSAIYDEVYRDQHAVAKDLFEAQSITPLLVDDIFDSAELTAMWKARQAADRIGCRYEFYLRVAFKRFFDRTWRNFPRPNQLYGEELVLDIADEWGRAKRATLQLAKDKRFSIDAYSGHPDQIAYHAYLVEQIKEREHQHMLLARLVFKERVLPLEVAGEHFSVDVLKRAKYF